MSFSRNRGFTLIEVLVSLVVTSMFTIGISHLIHQSMILHEKAELISKAAFFSSEVMALSMGTETRETDRRIHQIQRAIARQGWQLKVRKHTDTANSAFQKLTVTISGPDLSNDFVLVRLRRKLL